MAAKCHRKWAAHIFSYGLHGLISRKATLSNRRQAVIETEWDVGIFLTDFRVG